MNLPKKYLSWSQVWLWRNSPSQYIKRYFDGEKSYVTKEMKFGTYIGKLLEEKNLFAAPKEIAPILSKVPMYDEPERKFYKTLYFESDKKESQFDIIGYADSFSKRGDSIIIDEIKTGKKEWDQERVNEHKQLDTYAMLCFKEFGVIPEIRLTWLETTEIKGKIQLTGRVETFNRTVTIQDIEKIEFLFIDTAQEIEKAYSKYLGVPEVDFKLIQQFEEKSYELKDLQVQVKELKEKVHREFIDKDVDRLDGEAGKFYFTTRKKYDYPEDIKSLEEQLKKKKKQFEKNAEFKVSRSFNYKLMV